MSKEQFFSLKIFDWIAKSSIYAALFLTPIFFLPWTSEVLDFNKQILLLLLVMVSFFAWMLKVLISGGVEINMNKTHIAVGILLLIYIFSTIFSKYRYGSFWGWPQISSESLLSMLILTVFYFLITNIFSKKNIFTAIIVLFSSAFLVEIIGILQLFGIFVIPFSFTKSVIFNTVGTVGSMGFFSAILLPVSMIFLTISNKRWKIFFILKIIFSAILLFLINYSIIWWVVITGSVLVIILGVLKRELFDTRWMALPMFFLALSLFFMLLSGQVSWMPHKANEIFLSQSTSFDIAIQNLKENPIFGSGPGTFSYAFLKFKNADFSNSSLWNAVFNKATSKALNDLATMGILGFLSFLAIMIMPLLFATKFLFSKKPFKDSENNALSWILILSLSVSVILELLIYFIYNSNIVLDLLFFFFIASLVVLVSGEKVKYELKSPSLSTLFITFAFTLVFIFELGLTILNGQRYSAEVSYLKGISELQSNNLNSGILNLELAASKNSASDLYFRQLSQAYLLKLQKEISDGNTGSSPEDKNKIQLLVSNSINSGKIASDINPNNPINWSIRGYIYQNLFNIGHEEAGTWALNTYQEAIKLDPNNPYLLTQKGNVNFMLAIKSQEEQKTEFLSQAKDSLKKATSLNPNYSNGLYSLGLVYDALGQKDKAIEKFEIVNQLNPDNSDILKILSNLKSGKPALQDPNITPESPLDSENNINNSSENNSSPN